MYSRSFEGVGEPEGFSYVDEREQSADVFGGDRRGLTEKRRGTGLSKLFSDIKTEDLLLIAIALLLLMDGDPDNDILIIALAFLIFF